MSTSPETLRRTGGKPMKAIIYDAATIQQRVTEMGQEITKAYPEGDLLLIGILKGSVLFMADLVRAIERPVQMDFMVVSSYGAEKSSSGNVRLLYDSSIDLAGKHIVLVEDIIDSGRTLNRLVALLGERKPASLAIAALLDKRIAPEPPKELRFVGFHAPPAFLVGYGLDFAEAYRHLPFIADLE